MFQREAKVLKELSHPGIPQAGHKGAVNSVAISPDGQTIASGSDDETITLWNLNTEEEICTLDGHLDGVNAVAFSRNDQIIR